MFANLRVYRFDPEKDNGARYQSYSVDMPEYGTVLDALLKVREEIDGTLAMRCSCRSAICGSCAMHINGHAKLACKTKVTTIAPNGAEILVEPMTNMRIVKDLVTDMTMFWDKVKAVEPWLMPEGEVPEREYRVPNEAMMDLSIPMNCIMCGACVSDCTVLTVDKNFLGPAALAKAYRFAGDPRDAASKERLRELSAYSGIWDCVHCFECVEVCPKGVAPMDRIMQLREKAIKAGYTDNNGARHSKGFADIIKHSGWLDEVKLPIVSVGFNPVELISLAPVGIRMQLKKGAPSPIHAPIPKVHNVKRIFEKLEDK